MATQGVMNITLFDDKSRLHVSWSWFQIHGFPFTLQTHGLVRDGQLCSLDHSDCQSAWLLQTPAEELKGLAAELGGQICVLRQLGCMQVPRSGP